MTERLRHGGLEARDDGRTLEIDDPWGTRIRLAAAAPAQIRRESV